ncbi:hypothetical protein GCM10011529_09420 [Polymorphobacter glacialis]|uniref:DUF1294 domain-containing protein n=1 Tax=Sandarakinorhabdus glacialis TaxID=1614636 RepID=A0A916ZMT7_9SPHN|nr:DUF1294 domain-containing protein [Polymorphobacter glacialis]GGE05147.1 hypothetical protein GCM10011529_09420 [Polymorphobacter glacialis]
MPLLILAAATSFACLNPVHRDGDEIACAGRHGNRGASTQLYGIDAPRLEGECRPGRSCVPGDPIAARDHLAGLTRGKAVQCTTVNNDTGGVAGLRCTTDAVDLACAMRDAGLAIERQSPLNCLAPLPKTPGTTVKAPLSWSTMPVLWRWVPLFLIVVNLAAYWAIANDKKRVNSGQGRIAPTHLLTLVFFGGALGTLIAQQRFDHLKDEQPFANRFAILFGLQLGIVIGLVLPLFLA